MKVMSSVSTAFKVHYNQKLGGPIRPSWGKTHHGLWGGIDAPGLFRWLIAQLVETKLATTKKTYSEKHGN